MTITITIPPEARRQAMLTVYGAISGIDEKAALQIADAACLAMLENWPEVGFVREDINTPVSYLVLPLTENTNAET